MVEIGQKMKIIFILAVNLAEHSTQIGHK